MDSLNEFPHREVELLAFALWQERGTPIGTPEIDWFRAEQALKASIDSKSPLVSAGKTIGSALGAVAALVSAGS